MVISAQVLNLILKKRNVFVKNSGILTMTGGRIYSIKDKILESDNEDFLTYGDGVSDIDIDKLYKFHKKIKGLLQCLLLDLLRDGDMLF